MKAAQRLTVRRCAHGLLRPGRLCAVCQVVGARGRLRRRSIIGAMPVVAMVLAWRAQPGTYGFDAVELPRHGEA